MVAVVDIVVAVGGKCEVARTDLRVAAAAAAAAAAVVVVVGAELRWPTAQLTPTMYRFELDWLLRRGRKIAD